MVPIIINNQQNPENALPLLNDLPTFKADNPVPDAISKTTAARSRGVRYKTVQFAKRCRQACRKKSLSLPLHLVAGYTP